MSPTVHPPQSNQKFWPLKKLALGKSSQSNSDRQNAAVVTGGETKVKDAKGAAAITLVTLSKQREDTTTASSISQQRLQEKKGTSAINDVVPRNQDRQATIMPGSLQLKRRQRNSSSQNDTTSYTFSSGNNRNKESRQQSYSVQQQYPDDHLELPSHPPSLASFTPATTTEASQNTSPIFSGSVSTHDPPVTSINSDVGINHQANMPIKLKSRPRNKLLRPTSCTSLRQTAFYQMHHSPSPKQKNLSLIYDPTVSSDQLQQYQYHQNTINRSNTFNHVPQSYSHYRRSSESTLDDTLLTPNSENSDGIDDGINLRYYMDKDYYYYDDDEDDDDQTLFSNSVLSMDSIKPPPSPPPRRLSKRPMSLICQRLPDSHYMMEPSTFYRHQHSSHCSHHFDRHHYQQHSGVASMDLCIPYTDTYGYHRIPNTGDAASIPVSPVSTGSGPTADLPRPPHHSSRPSIDSDSVCFNNEKIVKSHHPQTKSQKSRQSTSQRYHLSMDLLKQELESERAVVYALQRQKDAYNKDITYLCQNVDVLAKEEKEWKTKFHQEKAENERCQNDLSVTIERFNEALERIKQLTNEKERLQLDLEHANHQLCSEKKSIPTSTCITDTSNSQQPHQDQQIKLIQTTIEQLLQLNLFGRTRCTITTTGSVEEKKRDENGRTMTRTNNTLSSISGQQHQRQPSATTHKSRFTSTKQNTSTSVNDNNTSSSPGTTSCTDSVPRNTVSSTNLDNQLQRLLQEKELLQAEYSKIPVSGGSPIYRRRREDVEARLDEVDSKMRKIRLKIRCRHKRLVV
ncbi:hypothetical protein BCR42DRAFT_471783 [Absidia repens]|uniref:Enkurin domain-containing protein n=1 Tax=Absidia repens TaxID=90262 RepID=A0A1X2I3A1_9FUNG|nr:hypothetical protein BCR42DRAFT_471783 [Absidia repens]